MRLDPLKPFLSDSPTEVLFQLVQVAPLIYCLVGSCWKWLTVANTIWLVVLLIILFALHILQRKYPTLTSLATSRRLIQGTKIYIFFVVLLTAILTFLQGEGAAVVEAALDKKIMRDGVVFYIDETVLGLAQRRFRPGPDVSFLQPNKTPEESIRAFLRGYDEDDVGDASDGGEKGGLFIAKLQRLPMPVPPSMASVSPSSVQLMCMLSGSSFRKLCIMTVLHAIGAVLGQAIMLSAVGILLIGALSIVILAMLEQLQKRNLSTPIAGSSGS